MCGLFSVDGVYHLMVPSFENIWHLRRDLWKNKIQQNFQRVQITVKCLVTDRKLYINQHPFCTYMLPGWLVGGTLGWVLKCVGDV